MKLIKELPKSIIFSLQLSLIPSKLLLRNKEELPVIVSLTSIPSRLKFLHLVIKSLFNQSHKPKKIIVWLNNEMENQLPASLKKIQSDLFEIKYTNLKCSHKKLIHTLEMYPEHIIITCDDDLIYRKKWLINLYKEHLKYPGDIIGNVTKKIRFGDNGYYLPYNLWKYNKNNTSSKTLLPIGAWGILYPPNSLSKEVFNKDLFLKLTPTADDLWFKAMALINNTISRQSSNLPKEPVPIINTQKVSLKKENVKNNKNDIQWQELSSHFQLDKLLKS